MLPPPLGIDVETSNSRLARGPNESTAIVTASGGKTLRYLRENYRRPNSPSQLETGSSLTAKHANPKLACPIRDSTAPSIDAPKTARSKTAAVRTTQRGIRAQKKFAREIHQRSSAPLDARRPEHTIPAPILATKIFAYKADTTETRGRSEQILLDRPNRSRQVSTPPANRRGKAIQPGQGDMLGEHEQMSPEAAPDAVNRKCAAKLHRHPAEERSLPLLRRRPHASLASWLSNRGFPSWADSTGRSPRGRDRKVLRKKN